MIRIENLHKSFGENHVLRGVDLTINKGETLVIIGGSGCGKSVLLKHIIGLLRPDRGHIWIDDLELTRMNASQLYEQRIRFGMLFQGAALFDSLTVGENVAFALEEHTEYSATKRAAIVREKLARVGLRGIEDQKPAELSGGMKKRVGLARAIAIEPEVILYDEPTTGLDPIMADVINELILKMQKDLNVTSVAVTHDMNSAYKIADRIAMLYEGQIIEAASPDKIKATQNPIVHQFITGKADGPITALQI